MKNIAVFFGGSSVEHDVSVITGVLTLNSLDRETYLPIPIYVSNEGVWYTGDCLNDLDEYKNLNYKKLKKVTFLPGDSLLVEYKKRKIMPLFKISAGINCMHGERGEDGSLCGFLNMCGVPLASPDLLSSSVSMDKCATKIFLKGLGVNTLPYKICEKATDLPSIDLKFPVIVKPACCGSSIGISIAKNKKELNSSLALAFRFGEKLIIEQCLTDFIEINCAAYKNSEGKVIISECERPVTAHEILTFEDKYKEGHHEFPAKIPKETSDKIKGITERVYSALGFSGIIRIDYLVTNEDIFLNEINSVPGSLAYYLFCKNLKEYKAVLTDIIVRCERRFSASSTLQRSFKTSILQFSGSKGSKRL